MVQATVGLDAVVHARNRLYWGTLERYLAGDGYGFIANDDGGDDFVHWKQFNQFRIKPRIGLRLQYHLIQDDDGRPQATNLLVIE